MTAALDGSGASTALAGQDAPPPSRHPALLGEAPVRIAAVGVPDFAEVPRTGGAEVTALDWRPPAAGAPDLAWRLAELTGHPAVEAANQEAVSRLLAVRPVWTRVLPAREAIGALDDRTSGRRLLLHAGPPIAWPDMCGPMRAGVIGAALLEGWAETPEAAQHLADSGALEFEPCHHHEAVGPMGGIVSPSMPVLEVEDAASGRRAYSNLNEGAGRCLRYGALGADVMERLRWMGEVLAPALSAALRARGEGVDLRAITAQALQMGDECHSRNTAASALLLRELAAELSTGEHARAVLRFLADNHYWFLNFSMAAAKLATSAAHGVPHSTLVTTFARNGVEVGIRVAGLGDSWFTAPATQVRGLYFAGYGPEDANPDIGDSAITETYGLGGFSLAAAPAITGFVGGTVEEALATSREMARISLARHEAYRLPALGGVGAPVGIDVRAVLDTGIAPVVTTGISHRKPGIGQIGAGLTHAPLECFRKALAATEVPPFATGFAGALADPAGGVGAGSAGGAGAGSAGGARAGSAAATAVGRATGPSADLPSDTSAGPARGTGADSAAGRDTGPSPDLPSDTSTGPAMSTGADSATDTAVGAAKRTGTEAATGPSAGSATRTSTGSAPGSAR